MIFLAQIFHISNGTTLLAGVMRTNFSFKTPCCFDLHVNGIFVQKLNIEGIALDNNYTVDEYLTKITVCMKGHLDKELVNDKVDAYLKYSVDQTTVN